MAISSTITSSNGLSALTASLRVPASAQVLLAGLHGVADLGEQVEGVGPWWWRSGRTAARPRAVSAPPLRSIIDTRTSRSRIIGPDRAQRGPQQRALARAGGSGDEHVLAQQAEQERVAVLVVPDIERRSGRPRADRAGMSGCGDDVVERHLPLDHDRRARRGGPWRSRPGARTARRPGRRRCSVQVVQVLPAGHPHVQGVDRRRRGADPQHARAPWSWPVRRLSRTRSQSTRTPAQRRPR